MKSPTMKTRTLSSVALVLSLGLPACLFLEPGPGMVDSNNPANNQTNNPPNNTANNLPNNTANNQNNPPNNRTNNVACPDIDCQPVCEFGPNGATFLGCEFNPETMCEELVETACAELETCDEVRGCVEEGTPCPADACEPEVDSACVEGVPGEAVILICVPDDVDCGVWVEGEMCDAGCAMDGGCALPDACADACEVGARRCSANRDRVEECLPMEGGCPAFVEVSTCNGRLNCRELAPGFVDCACNLNPPCGVGTYSCEQNPMGQVVTTQQCGADNGCPFIVQDLTNVQLPCGSNRRGPGEPYGCSRDRRKMYFCPGVDEGVCGESPSMECPDGEMCVLDKLGDFARCVPRPMFP